MTRTGTSSLIITKLNQTPTLLPSIGQKKTSVARETSQVSCRSRTEGVKLGSPQWNLDQPAEAKKSSIVKNVSRSLTSSFLSDHKKCHYIESATY